MKVHCRKVKIKRVCVNRISLGKERGEKGRGGDGGGGRTGRDPEGAQEGGRQRRLGHCVRGWTRRRLLGVARGPPGFQGKSKFTQATGFDSLNKYGHLCVPDLVLGRGLEVAPFNQRHRECR